MECRCSVCGSVFDVTVGAFNRAAKKGYSPRCSLQCAGIERRSGKTKEEKKAEKAAYDAEYRTARIDTIKARKHEYYKRTFDREKARLIRKSRMPNHVEYCRRPEYRQYKKIYDANRRDIMMYGEFATAARALILLEKEISSNYDWYDIATQKGTINKKLQRSRNNV